MYVVYDNHKSSRLTNIPGKSFVKIAKIEECGYEDVYNMEVNQTHNFSIESGLIVHNCRDAIRYGTEQFWNKSNQIQLSNRRLF